MDKFRALLSALLAFGLVIVGGAVAVSASARTPVVRADCDGVAVKLSQYNSSGINRVVVTIDGDVVDDAEFQTRYVETFDAPDKYTSYHYEVVVTAHDDPDATKGWTRTFSGDSTPCEQPGGGHTPVNVCHATSSDTNPYVFITVDDDSVKFKGHLMHRNSPNKTWKSDGVFRGEDVHAGDPKPDLIGDYTDKDGHLHEYDGDINSKSDCGTFTPPEVTTPTGSYSQECTDEGVLVTVGPLNPGTYGDVTWTLTVGSDPQEVFAGDEVLVQSGTQLVLSWSSGESSGTAKSGRAKDCPPPSEQVGKIKIEKQMAGPVAGASTIFTVRVDCPGTTYDQDVVLNAGNAWVATTTNIPTGTVCTLTEVKVPNGWNPEGITPDSVTVGTGTPSEVSAVALNKRRTGRVAVVKEMVGDPAGAGTEFTVHLDCDGTAYDRDLVLNAANDWEVIVRGIPSGIDCQVTEPTVPTGWELTSITPSGPFTIDSYDTIVVEVVNTRTPVPVDTGSVKVSKNMVGATTGASTSFSVLLDCDGTAYDRTLALNAANGWSVRVDGIPSGVHCAVTEPSVPAGWSLTSIVPAGSFVVQKGSTVAVTVTNTRETPSVVASTGVITVTKVLSGAANGAETSFVFDVNCPGTTYDQAVTVAVGAGTTASATTGQIPTGTTCTVTERSTANWMQTSVVPAGGAVAVGSTATFTNQRLTGALMLSKSVSPVAGDGVVVEFGDTLTYTLTVSTTGALAQPDVVVTDYVPGHDPARPGSGRTTYKPGTAMCIGAGTCSVTGPGADGLITWRLGDMGAGTSRQVTFQVTIDDVAIEPGEAVAVDVLNAGAARSAAGPAVPSNEVRTEVTEVLPVKEGNNPPPSQPGPEVASGTLPRTGPGLPVGGLVGLSVLLLLMGTSLLVVGGRKPLGVRS